jgi:hypothetical protein
VFRYYLPDREKLGMLAYEFYWLDPKGGYEIMGVLPERRKNSARVTQESIMQWGKTIFNKDFYPKDIFFIKVVMDQKTGRIFRPPIFTKPQKEV